MCYTVWILMFYTVKYTRALTFENVCQVWKCVASVLLMCCFTRKCVSGVEMGLADYCGCQQHA